MHDGKFAEITPQALFEVPERFWRVATIADLWPGVCRPVGQGVPGSTRSMVWQLCAVWVALLVVGPSGATGARGPTRDVVPRLLPRHSGISCPGTHGVSPTFRCLVSEGPPGICNSECNGECGGGGSVRHALHHPLRPFPFWGGGGLRGLGWGLGGSGMH